MYTLHVSGRFIRPQTNVGKDKCTSIWTKRLDLLNNYGKIRLNGRTVDVN